MIPMYHRTNQQQDIHFFEVGGVRIENMVFECNNICDGGGDVMDIRAKAYDYNLALAIHDTEQRVSFGNKGNLTHLNHCCPKLNPPGGGAAPSWLNCAHTAV